MFDMFLQLSQPLTTLIKNHQNLYKKHFPLHFLLTFFKNILKAQCQCFRFNDNHDHGDHGDHGDQPDHGHHGVHNNRGRSRDDPLSELQ